MNISDLIDNAIVQIVGGVCSVLAGIVHFLVKIFRNRILKIEAEMEEVKLKLQEHAIALESIPTDEEIKKLSELITDIRIKLAELGSSLNRTRKRD